MYAIGEKYNIQGLKALSKTKFIPMATSAWNHNNFFAAVCEIYKSTPERDRGLRAEVAKIACLRLPRLTHHPKFFETRRNVQGFAADILQELMDTQLDRLENGVILCKGCGADACDEIYWCRMCWRAMD